MKALAFDPDSRYPDARSFANALTRYLEGRTGRPDQIPRSTRKNGRGDRDDRGCLGALPDPGDEPALRDSGSSIAKVIAPVEYHSCR